MRNIRPQVKKILEAIEGRSLRPGLEETPGRVQRAFNELFDGYKINIESLFKTFDGEACDQIVILKNIEFSSTCEHHLLNFSGLVHVAYLPDKCALGASKIPRLVYAFSHRLQIQERIAEQIADTLMTHLKPLGVGVIIEGVHDCIRCRGVKNSSCQMINSVMFGEFRNNPILRAEVLSLLHGVK